MKNQKFAIGLAAALAVLLGGCERYSDAKNAVRATMLDPEATQFKDVKSCPGDTEIIRGQANGKNGYGAYGGFRSFFYKNHYVAFAEDYRFSAMSSNCYGPRVAEMADALATPTTSGQPARSPAATSADKKPAAKQAAADGDPMDNFTAEDDAALDAAMAKAASERCWQDYCPCDTNDPDYGGADVTICRNLKGGLAVANSMLSAGAALRDARRQMRESRPLY